MYQEKEKRICNPVPKFINRSLSKFLTYIQLLLELFLDFASQSCSLCLAGSTLQNLSHISHCCPQSSPMEALWPLIDS